MFISKFFSLNWLQKSAIIALTIITAIIIFFVISFTWLEHMSKYHFGKVLKADKNSITIVTKLKKEKTFLLNDKTSIYNSKHTNDIPEIGSKVFIISQTDYDNYTVNAKIVRVFK